MAETVLVDADLGSGRNVVDALDNVGGFNIQTAAWVFHRESDQWRLVLVSPLAEKGTLSAYKSIQKVLTTLATSSQLSMSQVVVLPPDDELARALADSVRTGPGLYSFRIVGVELGERFGHEIFVYRVSGRSAGEHSEPNRDELTKANLFFQQHGIEEPYWELLLWPTDAHETRTIARRDLRIMRSKARVVLRGWDFPHIDRRNDRVFDSGIESWTDARYHKEAHRFYQSGLFIWRRLFQEEREQGLKGRLMYRGTIYLLTEMLTFAARLTEGLLTDQVRLSIMARGLRGRALWEKGAHLDEHVSQEEAWQQSHSITAARLREGYDELARSYVRDLFEIIGLFPEDEEIATIQQELLSKTGSV